MLYVVGTPIGNLEDISLRALRILGEVDFILCEDTRVSSKLLAHYKINTKLISFHQHSSDSKIEEVLRLLENNKNLALITDAGTPGISDPGGKLIAKVIEHFANDPRGEVESVPGPSALTAALSISGLPIDKFIFMGFPPHKNGRQTFIKKVLESDYPVIVYESKHRIIKFLEELKSLNQKNLISVVVFRELSKMHETVYRGELDVILEKIKNNTNDQKGEFVVVVGK